jgi:hypothetical protein
VIVLSEDGITERLIPHEIAHAWSNHGGIVSATEEEEEEEEADRLATEWGFTIENPSGASG